MAAFRYLKPNQSPAAQSPGRFSVMLRVRGATFFSDDCFTKGLTAPSFFSCLIGLAIVIFFLLFRTIQSIRLSRGLPKPQSALFYL